VNIISRGGSDKYHATVFEFLRNSALDANTWENNRASVGKPVFQRNQFGGNISGPLWKSKKLYFVGAYEGLRQGTPETRTASLPTALERSGDFSQTLNSNGTLSTVYNPFSAVSDPSTGGYLRAPFPGNRIPQSMWDPIGARILGLYPQPNAPGDPFTHANNFIATSTRVARTDRFYVRGDWVPNEKETMYLRFSRAPVQDNRSPSFFGVVDDSTTSVEPRQQATFGNTFVPTPNWVINVLVGHGSWREQRFPNNSGTGELLGFPASLVSQFQAQAIPFIRPTGYYELGSGQILRNHSRTENVQANLSKQQGSHNLKFGFSAEWAKLNGGWISSATFNFNRGMTSGPVAASTSTSSGSSLASLLIGTGSDGSATFASLPTQNKAYYAAYFQDNWRVSRKLTLNLGLRWEVQKPTTDRYDRYSTFDYNAANPLSSATGLPLRGGLNFLGSSTRYPWDTDWRNFAPRFGFAYKLTGRIVARGGYGIMYPAVLASGNIAGYSSTTPWVASVGGNGINPQDVLQNPFPQGLLPIVGSSQGLMTNVGVGVAAVNRHLPTNYVQNYSFDLQFQIQPTAVLEIGYSGNQGRKLPWGIGINDNQLPANLLSLGPALDQQIANPFYGYIPGGPLSGPTVPRQRLLRPFPEFDSVTRTGMTPGASSSYNALIASLTKRYESGLTLLVTYQWSKSIDNASETQSWEGGGDGFRNYQDLSIERSISAHDIPQSFVTSLVYELPVGKGKRFASDMPAVGQFLLGGWEVGTIARFQSGLPLQVSAPSTIGQYGFGVQRPNLSNAAEVAVSNRTPEHWFNTAAFTLPTPDTIGSMPRRITELRTDSTHHADVSILKNFRPTERMGIQFRAEFFNITNTPQFGRPDNTFGSTTFGQVTYTTNVPPRNIQFGLKIDF
jgi:hypothetical protein